MRRLLIAGLALVMLLVGGGVARAADIQKSGPQVWPGKLQVTVHPIGGQFGFTGNEISGYRFIADIAGLIKEFDKFTLWLGGGFMYTPGFFYCGFNRGGRVYGCGHDLGLWAFIEFSLDKLGWEIPLVPFVRVGPGAEILFYPGGTGGAFTIRVGSGIHYFITKNVGLGGEMNITAGPGFGFGGVFGYATWDGALGARFAF